MRGIRSRPFLWDRIGEGKDAERKDRCFHSVETGAFPAYAVGIFWVRERIKREKKGWFREYGRRFCREAGCRAVAAAEKLW